MFDIENADKKCKVCGVNNCEVFSDYCFECYTKIADEREEKEKAAEIEKKQHEKTADESFLVRMAETEWEQKAKISGVGKRHRTCTVGNYVGDASKIIEWGQFDQTENLLIQSVKSGNGKTHLAVSALKVFVENVFRKHGYTKLKEGLYVDGVRLGKCYFITFSELMLKFRGAFNGGSETENDLQKELLGVHILVIDDIGAEKVSEYALSVLYIILNARYEKMIPTIITTNLTSEEILSTYGARMLSRIASGHIVQVNGRDERVVKKTTRKITHNEEVVQ